MMKHWTGAFWLVLIVCWWLPALTAKRGVQRQSFGSRLLQFLVEFAGIVLIFNLWRVGRPGLLPGWLNARFIPATAPWVLAGVALTSAGVAFAVWSRFTLGRNWSGRPSIKQNHELILRGPYTLVRHPIYTGLLTGLLGTTLIYGAVRCLVGVLICALALWIKSRTEEGFMLQKFGEQYAQYREHTCALIPFVL